MKDQITIKTLKIIALLLSLISIILLMFFWENNTGEYNKIVGYIMSGMMIISSLISFKVRNTLIGFLDMMFGIMILIIQYLV